MFVQSQGKKNESAKDRRDMKIGVGGGARGGGDSFLFGRGYKREGIVHKEE